MNEIKSSYEQTITKKIEYKSKFNGKPNQEIIEKEEEEEGQAIEMNESDISSDFRIVHLSESGEQINDLTINEANQQR